MKIAVVASHNEMIGGCEAYLREVLPALAQAGQEIGFWHEFQPSDRAEELWHGTPVWRPAAEGRPAALARLRQWKPDLLYVHGLSDPAMERQLLDVGPGVLFLHGFHGACVSGAKLWQRGLRSCPRAFGPGCLLAYYPRRCGGWNPITMWKEYRRQDERRRLLGRYRALLTHSEFMVETFRREGIPGERLFKVPFPVPTRGTSRTRVSEQGRGESWRLLFAGRCEVVKGGALLLNALPECLERLKQPIELVIAGHGREKDRWQTHARRLSKIFPQLRIRFEGWVTAERLKTLYDNADLLVFPSVWPEPFGLSGAEAVASGVPVAAFDLGGVREWLTPGVNGVLTSGNPPTAHGLAEAIVEALRVFADPPGRVLFDPPLRFEMRSHLEALEAIFNNAISSVSQEGFA